MTSRHRLPRFLLLTPFESVALAPRNVIQSSKKEWARLLLDRLIQIGYDDNARPLLEAQP